jgi:hypothetical protein
MVRNVERHGDDEYIMLSGLIPGPHQPGNDIDTYFRPLVDDLKLLWCKGVEV